MCIKAFLIFIFISIGYIGFAQDSTQHIYPTQLQKGKLFKVIAIESTFYLSGNAYLQYIWYKDSKRVPFHFYNDNAGYLQIDKFGHAYSAYNYSVAGYRALRNAGIPKNKALIYGGPLGLFLQTPIEVFDGLYEHWGFSWGDMIANTVGSAFAVSNELLFDEQLLKYKLTYSSSEYRAQANGYLGNSALEGFFYDYNAHTYWVSMPINAIVLKEKLPDWMCISIGYSANGMFGEFKNKTSYRGVAIPETERYRQFLISADIDCTKIKTKSKVLRKVLNTVAFIKLPFPTFEVALNGKTKRHWIYF